MRGRAVRRSNWKNDLPTKAASPSVGAGTTGNIVNQSSKTAGQPITLAEEDVLRADLYGMLAQLLASPPSQDLLDRAAADGPTMSQFLARLEGAAQQRRMGRAVHVDDILRDVEKRPLVRDQVSRFLTSRCEAGAA